MNNLKSEKLFLATIIMGGSSTLSVRALNFYYLLTTWWHPKNDNRTIVFIEILILLLELVLMLIKHTDITSNLLCSVRLRILKHFSQRKWTYFSMAKHSTVIINAWSCFPLSITLMPNFERRQATSKCVLEPWISTALAHFSPLLFTWRYLTDTETRTYLLITNSVTCYITNSITNYCFKSCWVYQHINDVGLKLSQHSLNPFVLFHW